MEFLRRQKKIITVIEIDHNWLRIIQVVQFRREKKVSAVVAKDIHSLSDEAVGEMLRGLSGELKINPNYLIVSIPRTLVTTRNLELPSTNPQEIKEMVELQVDKQTPYTNEEMIRDYHILYSSADGYARVLLVIVHRDIVKRYFKILDTAGLRTERIGFSSEGLLNWSRIIHRDRTVINKPYVLLELDYDTGDFEVVLNDKIIFGRSISSTFPRSQEIREQWQKKFIKDISHSIYAYQNEVMDKEIDRILISAPRVVCESLGETVLEDALGLPVEIIEQFKNVPVTPEALNSYNSLTHKDLSFSGLIGLALTFGEQEFDLTPQEVRIERVVKERGKDLYLTGILLVFILVAVSGIFLGRIYSKERYLGQIKQKLMEIQDKIKELSNQIGVIETVKDRVATKGTSLNLIYEVHRVISPDIHLISLSFDGEENLVIRGTSNVMSEVFVLVSKLEESEHFQNVKTKYATKHKDKDKEITDFEILCHLEDKYKNIYKRGL